MNNPDVKRKISQSCKGRKPWNLGLKVSPMKDETKEKISENLKKKRWYTNGIKDVFSDVCPDGFVSGRSLYKRGSK